MMFEQVETILGICHDKRIFATHPNLEAFHIRMKALPAFGAYLASDKFLAAPFFIPMVNLVM